MTYIVTESCIRCKYMDCVEVCPVDCFYEGENILVIHPDECIDCGVCEPECPIEAIIPDTGAPKDSSLTIEQWVEMNRDYAQVWPKIIRKGTSPDDADQWSTTKNKFKDHFSPKPGKGS